MPLERFLPFLVLLPVSCIASFSHVDAQTVSATPMQMPETIDGATNPELIPDDVALSVWLLAVSETSSAPTDVLLRMQAKLGAVVLSPDDHLILSKAVIHFADKRESFRVREESLADASTVDGQQQRQQLATDRQALYLETKQLITTTLSKEGQQSFKRHLLRVKQHMRVGQGPRM